jgi:hypothetical protein
MAKSLDDLTEAEWQLLMILRDPKEQREGVKITIIIDGALYAVRLESLQVGRSRDGEGDSFSSAWDAI